MSRCFVGCLGQARKCCSNRCSYGLRNYASDVRPTDPLAAGVESPCQTLAPGDVFCTTSTVVCCVFSSHSFWTSSSLDVPAGVTQEEGHTGFFIYLPSAVRALIFSREKDSAIRFPRQP